MAETHPIRRDFTPPPRIESEILRQAATYWLNLCPEAGFPAYARLDPVDMPRSALPCLWVVDWTGPATGFRFRLAGERIASVFNHKVRSRFFEEAFRDSPVSLREAVRDRFCRVVDTGAICHCAGAVYLENGLAGAGERLILPMAEHDRGPVRYLLGITDFVPAEQNRKSVAVPGQVRERFFPVHALPALCSRDV